MSDARPETYSYSRLSSFDKCPRQYELKYIEKKPEAFQSVEAFLGSTVHEALAWLYGERQADRDPPLERTVEAFDAAWQGGLRPSVKTVRSGDSFDRHRDRGHRLLRDHYRAVFLNDRLETMKIEEQFHLTLAKRFRYTGVVDRIARSRDGSIHVIDFKTTARPPDRLDAEAALQLRSYGLGCIVHEDLPSVTLSFQYLENSTSVSEHLDRHGANGVVRVLVEKIDRVESVAAFPPTPSGLCGWCGYREECDASGYSTTAKAGSSAADDHECPRCGGDLELRHGRRGPFWGCESYPECRYTRDADEDEIDDDTGDDEICPRCGGALELRTGRYGEFLGCEEYPDCRYSRDP